MNGQEVLNKHGQISALGQFQKKIYTDPVESTSDNISTLRRK
jgi:hypothetical protein